MKMTGRMRNNKWDNLSRWAQELITWVCRDGQDIEEDNIILRLFIKDGVLYKVERQQSNTRGGSRGLAFEKDLANPLGID